MKLVILLPALALCGCAADLTTPVQTGIDRFTLFGSESSVATPAQTFCREQGFSYAQTTFSHHDDYGEHTTFFCMREGDKLVSTAPAVHVDVYNHH